MSIERRNGARVMMERPCKVFIKASQRFAPARTSNVSPSGAMLEVSSGRMLSPGDEIGVGIGWGDAPILRESQMKQARVVRALTGPDGVQRVAVRFAGAVQAESGLAAA